MVLLQLEYFRALAYEQHVLRTAEKLHISQPALSMTIKKLEASLGVPLFNRIGRSIELNQYGKLYLEYVEQVFTALDNGSLAIQQAAKIESQKLRMGLLNPYMWQDLIDSFSNKHRDISISQISIEVTDVNKYIMQGEVDFYIGALDFPHDTISSNILYQDNMILMVNKNHPLADRKHIDLSDARNEKFIMLPSNTSLQRFNNLLCELAGFIPQIALDCDYSLREDMVRHGYGVSLTTKRSSLISHTPDIVSLDIDSPNVKRTIYLVWKKRRIMTAPMKSFYNFAVDYYSSYHPDSDAEK